MTSLYKSSLAAAALGAAIFLHGFTPNKGSLPPVAVPTHTIQVAILLDVSSSMDGLLAQAKTQLWNMVSVVGKARCDEARPRIEIALYEYGRTSNLQKNGYVKQLSPFTTNLDSLSQILFSLTTNGGEEYCGQAIATAVDSMQWNSDPRSYKVIFIAGNESFLQGNVLYTTACEKAASKGIVVNTIYCGPRAAGISEHWDLGASCGTGAYTSINQNELPDDPPTPYDSILLVKNTMLNGTYLAFGNSKTSAVAMSRGDVNSGLSGSVSGVYVNSNKSAAMKRVEVKATNHVYRNESWDLVDASDKDTGFLDRLPAAARPDSLKALPVADFKEAVERKRAERTIIQADIIRLTKERREWIEADRKKTAALAADAPATLQTEIERIVRSQATRIGMTIDQ